jgi:hypothetical protein
MRGADVAVYAGVATVLVVGSLVGVYFATKSAAAATSSTGFVVGHRYRVTVGTTIPMSVTVMQGAADVDAPGAFRVVSTSQTDPTENTVVVDVLQVPPTTSIFQGDAAVDLGPSPTSGLGRVNPFLPMAGLYR